jgi:hypothetical protein
MAEYANLPWQIQVSLASGYAAYMLAYLGMKESHRTIDTTFLVLAFGLIATGALWVLTDQPNLVAGVSAFVLTLTGAFLWRKWGMDAVRWFFRLTDMSWLNNDPSALATLTRSTKYYVKQIGVELDDGTWLTCEDAAQFADAPFGPCAIGPSGDIGLYLTHIEKRGRKQKRLSTVRDSVHGDRITYIPATRIRQITVRHLPR